MCICSSNYDDDCDAKESVFYGDEENCEFHMAAVPLKVEEFEVEKNYDKVEVIVAGDSSFTEYTGLNTEDGLQNGPEGVVPNADHSPNVKWTSDGTIAGNDNDRSGWKICVPRPLQSHSSWQ